MGINQFKSSILDSNEKPTINKFLFTDKKERVHLEKQDEKQISKTLKTGRRNVSSVDLKFDP